MQAKNGLSRESLENADIHEGDIVRLGFASVVISNHDPWIFLLQAHVGT